MARIKAVKNVANRRGLPTAKKQADSSADKEVRPKVCRYCKHSFGPRCKVAHVDEYFMCKCDATDEWSKFVDSTTCNKFEYRQPGDFLDTKIRKG